MSNESIPNKTQGTAHGKVHQPPARKLPPKPVERTGVFHGGGRDNKANPKYSEYTDTKSW